MMERKVTKNDLIRVFETASECIERSHSFGVRRACCGVITDASKRVGKNIIHQGLLETAANKVFTKLFYGDAVKWQRKYTWDFFRKEDVVYWWEMPSSSYSDDTTARSVALKLTAILLKEGNDVCINR